MTQNAHIPTPWIFTPSGETMQGYSQPFAIAETDKYNLVAGIFGDVKGGVETAEANAAFIVRACNSHEELLEALKQLVEAGPVYGMINNAPFLNAKAAIARATGGQS